MHDDPVKCIAVLEVVVVVGGIVEELLHQGAIVKHLSCGSIGPRSIREARSRLLIGLLDRKRLFFH